MEKNYMPPHAILSFEFLEDGRTAPHTHENPELLFVLEGEMQVKTDHNMFTLRSEDFLVVNANRTHSYTSKGNLLAVRLQISLLKLNEILRKTPIVFWCFSAEGEEKSAAYSELRAVLKEIVLNSINKGTKDAFYVNSLHYRLLSLLCSGFLLGDIRTDSVSDAGSCSENERMDRVMEYIRMNFRDPISLQDVADELFLSTTYLSKYIHRKSGRGFVDLINDVRLSHAIEDLMYTENPIARIAMDNGFPSVAALNKVFKETYKTTPSEYRKREKTVTRQDSSYEEKAAMYLHRHLNENADAAKGGKECDLTLATENYVPMPLKQVMNVGRAADLLGAGTQKQILYGRDEWGIRNVRFWNVFEEEMHLGRSAGIGQRNYDRLDEILDFLTENKLVPYIDLRSKPVMIRQTAAEASHVWQTGDDFESDAERKAFFEAFFGHLIRRYGRGEVSRWSFHYPLRSNVAFADKEMSFTPVDENALERYLEEFDTIADALHARFPDGKIGGALLPVQHYGREGLGRIFAKWGERRNLPDFITFTSFPYQIVQEKDRWYERRRTGLLFVEDDVKTLKAALSDSPLKGRPAHLLECNLTLSNRSYINDTVMRAAFFADTITRIYDRADCFGIWNMRDAYSNYMDSPGLLFGGSGILTKYGQPKPAAFVLEFLNRLYQESVTAREGCLISMNAHRHYKLLLSHSVNMNAVYYVKEENRLAAPGIEQMTESNEKKIFHIRIEGIEEGSWQIRCYSLRREEGSVLNEWINLNMMDDPGKAEQTYLEKRCVPRLSIRKENTRDGALVFDAELEPNEVQYLHITEYN